MPNINVNQEKLIHVRLPINEERELRVLLINRNIGVQHLISAFVKTLLDDGEKFEEIFALARELKKT
jgi:hypothetical protein